MAIKRADVRAVFEGVEGITDGHISKILSMVHAELDAVKDERDELRDKLNEVEKTGGNDAQKWKDKYEKEHSDFENFKAELKTKEEIENKKTALKELLKDAELSDKGQAMALKYADIDKIELDDKGKIKDAKEILKSMKEEWSDYATESKREGSSTSGKDGAGHNGGNGSGSAKMTKEEIMKIKDASERQKAIADNHELFGF